MAEPGVQPSPVSELIDRIVKQVNKEQGSSSVMTFNSEGSSIGVKEYISTGSLFIDSVIGRPGIPVGRLTLINGLPMAGKSTLLTHLFVETQRMNGIAILLDTERTFDPDRAAHIGVDLNHLIISQPQTLEEAFTCLIRCVNVASMQKVGGPICIGFDTVSAAATKSQVEAKPEETDRRVAEHARIISQELRRVMPIVSDNRVALVFLNQPKQIIAVRGFGGGWSYLGAHPQDYHSSLTLTLSFRETLKFRDEAYGIKVRVKVSKNKLAPPLKETLIDILFATGISEDEALLEKAVDVGLIAMSGKAWYKLGGENFRKSGWSDILTQYPDLRQSIRDLIFKASPITIQEDTDQAEGGEEVGPDPSTEQP